MTIALLHLGRTAAGPLFTLELARAMTDAGIDVCVIYSADAEIAEEFAQLPCPTLAVPTFSGLISAGIGTIRLPAISRRIDEFLRGHDVRTLVITMEQVWQALLARRLQNGRKVLLFVHDATAHPGEEGRIRSWLTKRQRDHADGALVLSEHVEQALIARETFTPARIWRTVHPAFAVQSIESRVTPSRRPVIGFFGRMSRYKGLDLGVEAIAELRKRGYDIEFRIVGRGIPLDIPNITDNGNVLLDRWVPQNEVTAEISAFDVLLLPYREASQSGVLAYSMALGIPAVVTPVGGLIEQARETGAAIVADEVSATALADRLSDLIGDERAYSAVSEAALRSAENDFSWSRTGRDVAAAAAAISRD